MINNSGVRANVNALTSKEDLAIILEITPYQNVGVIYRITDFSKGIVSNGHTYSFESFKFTKQPALSGEVPRGSLVVDNVGQELIREIERTGGGRGVVLRAALVRPSLPDQLIDEVFFEITSTSVTLDVVSFSLVVSNNFERPAVRWSFDNKRYGGLFI